MQANNPFRNPRPAQSNGIDNGSHGGGRGGYSRGKRGNFQSGSRGSFNGRGNFRGDRGRGGYGRGGRGRGGRGRGGFQRPNSQKFENDEMVHRNHKNTDEIDIKEKEENWGKVKFNPVAATAKAEEATPWFRYKQEILQNKEDVKINSTDSKNLEDLKEQRSKENLKTKILLNQQKPTQWDDFGTVASKTENKKVEGVHTKTENEDNKKKKRNKNKQNKDKSEATPEQSSVESKSTGEQSNDISSSLQTDAEKLLQNFEANSLNTKQKNFLRKLITKNTCIVKNNSLRRSVQDMKRQHELKIKKKELKNKSKLN